MNDAASKPTTADEIEKAYNIPVSQFQAMSPADRSLFRGAYACDFLHVREGASYDPSTGKFVAGPPYNNVGPDVNRYCESAGVSPGNPWCAAFKTCMLLDSGVAREELPDLAASVHGWLLWAKSKNRILAKPVRGCVGLIIESATAGHLVTVTHYDEDTHTIETIEGNTNEGGSRDGYGVFRRTRPVSEFHCFVDLSKLTS